MTGPSDEGEVTRGDRFIKTAVEILGETGRTDFTVQEVVARSKTSLRAFYQHFSSKDELLLALFDRTIAQSVQIWRAETTGLDSTSALKLVIDRISQQPESSTQDSLNRALSLYNQHLAETRPREYARVLSPLHQLIRDIVGQGITEGVFNPGLDVGAAAAIVMQTMMGAQRLHWLGTRIERNADRRRPAVRLLQPRPRHPRHRRRDGRALAGRAVRPDRHACRHPQWRVRDDDAGQPACGQHVRRACRAA